MLFPLTDAEHSPYQWLAMTRTAMPDLGVTDEDARHIAAYLYSLR